MKHLLLASLAITTLTISPVWAGDDDHDHGHDEERTRHYNIQEPTSWSEAIHILEQKGTEMKAAYAAKDYTKIHELSYHLEVAADYLNEESEELMEAVGDVHHATEDGEYKELDAKFPALRTHLDTIVGK